MLGTGAVDPLPQALVLTAIVIGFGLIAGYGYLIGMDMQATLSDLNENSLTEEGNFIRTNLLLNHLTTFVFPAIVSGRTMVRHLDRTGHAGRVPDTRRPATDGSLCVVAKSRGRARSGTHSLDWRPDRSCHVRIDWRAGLLLVGLPDQPGYRCCALAP